jgi:hypothetical protein
MTPDPRLVAFCSTALPELFHGVVHQHQIWDDDPCDVEAIHREARAAFDRLLVHVRGPGSARSRQILVLLGESGCGKTHLIHAFRNRLHMGGLGYLVYVQMTSSVENYERYLLSNTIDSLDRRYADRASRSSGLMRLSHALAEAALDTDTLKTLRSENLDRDALRALVEQGADGLLDQDRFASLDLDLARALLYLQRDSARTKSRVLKWLRCENLSSADRTELGDLVPRTSDDALPMIQRLAHCMWVTQQSALVVALDQFENLYDPQTAKPRFQRVARSACVLTETIPSAMVLICCLKDYYSELRQHLTKPDLDRIERDLPIDLESRRSAEEIEQLVGKRLEYLYSTAGASFDRRDPIFPFERPQLRSLARMRTRDVLDRCRAYREGCVAAGHLVPFPAAEVESAILDVDSEITELAQQWNDHRSSAVLSIPDGDAELQGILQRALENATAELEDATLQVSEIPEGLLVVGKSDGIAREPLFVALCNQAPQGGRLSRRLALLQKSAGGRRMFLMRSTEFPSNPKTRIAQDLAKLVLAQGACRVVVSDSEWRTMLAMESFRELHERSPQFSAWLTKERPLSQIPALREMLALEVPLRSGSMAASPASDSKSAPVIQENPSACPLQPEPRAPDLDSEQIHLGSTGGLAATPVAIALRALTSHAAFLGGSGSGKTTLAMRVVEDLLLRGISAILVDRKGDLCEYASPSAWNQAQTKSRDPLRLKRLRDVIDVVLYTPGHSAGRPLSIGVAPDGMAELKASERDQLSGYAASAIGEMLSYKATGKSAARIVILRKAIELAASHRRDSVTLPDLVELIDSQDPALVKEVGKLDPKLFRGLVQDLETLRLSSGSLLAADAEHLEIGELLGRGSQKNGRTRLSILSTKFLGDRASVLFWVARFLGELNRWASRNPAPTLQAVVFFDEADLYLPASGKPATKEPMENLLKRSRSAGLGILLATQSPGDLDYRCRDTIRSWFVGRVKEPTALQKMKPMLSQARVDPTQKIASQAPGQFHWLCEGDVTAFEATRNLIPAQQRSEEEILALASPRSSRGPE